MSLHRRLRRNNCEYGMAYLHFFRVRRRVKKEAMAVHRIDVVMAVSDSFTLMSKKFIDIADTMLVNLMLG